MTDIVKRLRGWALSHESAPPPLLELAADEIERLHARLEVAPHGIDGITARDETIRMLEEARDELRAERDRYRAALELIAAPQRPDNTWNRDRLACQRLAAETLGDDDAAR